MLLFEFALLKKTYASKCAKVRRMRSRMRQGRRKLLQDDGRRRRNRRGFQLGSITHMTCTIYFEFMSPPPLFRHVRQIGKIGKIKATFSVCMSYVFALMTLARVGVGEGGEWVRGERRRHAAAPPPLVSCLFSCRLFPNPTKRNASQASGGGGGGAKALISL